MSKRIYWSFLSVCGLVIAVYMLQGWSPSQAILTMVGMVLICIKSNPETSVSGEQEFCHVTYRIQNTLTATLFVLWCYLAVCLIATARDHSTEMEFFFTSLLIAGLIRFHQGADLLVQPLVK